MEQVRVVEKPARSIDNLIPLDEDELQKASTEESLEMLSGGNSELRSQLEAILNANSDHKKDSPIEIFEYTLKGIKVLISNFWSKLLRNAFVVFYLPTELRRVKTKDNFHSPPENIFYSALFHLALLILLPLVTSGKEWVPAFYIMMLVTNIISGLLEIGRYDKTAKEIKIVEKKYPTTIEMM